VDEQEIRREALRVIGRTLRHDGHAAAEVLSAIDIALGPLPRDYVDFIAEFDGAEGWVGDEYVALWNAADLVRYNRDLRLDLDAPGLVLIGTNGGGEGFGFDRREGRFNVVMVPLIGVTWDLAIDQGPTFTDWLLGASRAAGGQPPSPVDPALVKKNVYEVKPVALGGDPSDPRNKQLVDLNDLIPIVRWWNDRLRRT
jgi:hypothetical protein